MKALIIIVLLSLATLIVADDVLQLGDSNFESELKLKETALVMFFAPWCGHCKRLKPEFQKAASTLKDNDPPVALVQVDCTEEGKETCSKFGVSGYPTIKIFRDGDLSSDYNGPREFAGIVKYMKGQVGPASKALSSVAEAEDFLSKKEVAVVYFGEGSLKDAFMKVADKMRETVRFGHSTSSDINKKYGYDDKVVLFRNPAMANKFEPSFVIYQGSSDSAKIENFVKNNYHGLVGHKTPDNAADFVSPLVTAYYEIDYMKNPKGTNYWRNRVLKVAKKFEDDFFYAIAAKDNFQHELEEFGLEVTNSDKPIVCAKNYKEEKFVMKDEFSMENLENFLEKLKASELEPFVKSEPVPDNEGAAVKVAVGKNFEELVTNSGRDTLIEFYAPWCGHCKKLAPIFDELGEKMKDEDVDIIKMDSTANDVPRDFNVKGFPTLFWRPKSGQHVNYEGGREVKDFIQYIAKHSTDELKGYDRKGTPKEASDKIEL